MREFEDPCEWFLSDLEIDHLTLSLTDNAMSSYHAGFGGEAILCC